MRPSRTSRLLASISQVINVGLFNGDEDEMLSSRAYRCKWKSLEKAIDFFFGNNHCKESYEWEKLHYNVDRFK